MSTWFHAQLWKRCHSTGCEAGCRRRPGMSPSQMTNEHRALSGTTQHQTHHFQSFSREAPLSSFLFFLLLFATPSIYLSVRTFISCWTLTMRNFSDRTPQSKKIFSKSLHGTCKCTNCTRTVVLYNCTTCTCNQSKVCVTLAVFLLIHYCGHCSSLDVTRYSC